MRPPPAPDLPQLPRSPFLHAVLSTPADRTGACRYSSLSARPSPVNRRVGIHNFTFEACLSFTRVTAYKIARPPKADFCPEAPAQPVAQLSRSVATMSHRQLHVWILLPLVICAVGAHVESRKGARPGPTGSRRFPFPAHRTGHADFPHPALRQISPQAHGRRPRWTSRNRSTPNFPNTTVSEKVALPREDTLCRRRRKARTRS